MNTCSTTASSWLKFAPLAAALSSNSLLFMTPASPPVDPPVPWKLHLSEGPHRHHWLSLPPQDIPCLYHTVITNLIDTHTHTHTSISDYTDHTVICHYSIVLFLRSLKIIIIWSLKYSLENRTHTLTNSGKPSHHDSQHFLRTHTSTHTAHIQQVLTYLSLGWVTFRTDWSHPDVGVNLCSWTSETPCSSLFSLWNSCCSWSLLLNMLPM